MTQSQPDQTMPTKLLFIGTIEGPITGQSVAGLALLASLEEDHEVTTIDLQKPALTNGIGSVRRILDVLSVIGKCRKAARSSDVIYLTIAQSKAGNLRDLGIYLAFGDKIRHTVIHLHGGTEMAKRFDRKRSLTTTVNRFFLRKIGAVVVLGERMAPIFDNVTSPDRVHVVPNCMHPSLLVSPDQIDRKFQNPSPVRFVFLSNFVDGKGHQELVEAYASLSSEAKRAVRIDFAGAFQRAEDMGAFEAAIAEFPGVRYRGVVTGQDKRDLLSAAHVFCLPTYYRNEGQPISILEAYASGCAVITTDHGGIFDVFTDGENGIGCTPRSVDSLRSALLQALADPRALAPMARHNREQAEGRFSQARHLDHMRQIIREVAPESPANHRSV